MKDFSKISVLKAAELQSEIEAGNFGDTFEGLDGFEYFNLRGRNTATGKRQLLKVRVTKNPGDLDVSLLKEVNGIEYFSCATKKGADARKAMLLKFGFKAEAKPAAKPAAGKPATERKKR